MKTIILWFMAYIMIIAVSLFVFLLTTTLFAFPIGIIFWLSNIVFDTTFVVWKCALLGGAVAALVNMYSRRDKE